MTLINVVKKGNYVHIVYVFINENLSNSRTLRTLSVFSALDQCLDDLGKDKAQIYQPFVHACACICIWVVILSLFMDYYNNCYTFFTLLQFTTETEGAELIMSFRIMEGSVHEVSVMYIP